MAKSIGEILIEKLTPEELSMLCDAHDDESLRDAFEGELLPEDQVNHPEKYNQIDKIEKEKL